MAEHWRCPYCQRDTTITNENVSNFTHIFDDYNKYNEPVGFKLNTVTCPNPECREISAIISLYQTYDNNLGRRVLASPPIKTWELLPEANVKLFPDYIPEQILSDYAEACRIKELSAKASATLSRRCLQGMIRDFWEVSKDNLYLEMEAIKDEVDPLTWQAINAVRSIGNIGAHMEKDVDLIIDVDPEEAKQLITLIETLLHEWYVVKHEREKKMQALVQIAEDKKQQKNGNGNDTPETAEE